jgi:hypothetical protein
LTAADGGGQTGVAHRSVGEEYQMTALGIGHTVLWRSHIQRELGAEHGRELDGARRFGEAHHPVEAVVVGEGQGLETESGGLLGQLLRMRRPVEEGEIRMAVQLGVRHLANPAATVGRLVRLAFARPCRPVATRVPRRAAGRPAGGKPALELTPGHRRVVESHPSQYRTHVRFWSRAGTLLVQYRNAADPQVPSADDD